MFDAIPAATLILLRDVPGGPPEIPMVGRGAHLVFAASRMVFPGGRVDPDDHLIASRSELLVEGEAIDRDDLAHRIAAVRETIEEIGLAPGMAELRDFEILGAIRAELHGGQPLSAILARRSLRIDPHAIHPFARWRPDHELSRRFDTRFYIARAPEIGEAMADGVESSHCVWGTAEAHLASGSLIFPTMRNLERIALAGDFDSAVEFTRRHSVEVITPWVERRDEIDWLCIPEGLGYPVTAQLLSSAERGSGASRPPITDTPG